MGIIYTATNTVNNKIYVGQTTQPLKQRIYQHKSDAKRRANRSYYFYNAIQKYGFDAFVWEEVAEADDLDILDELEIFYMNLFDSTNRDKGYNLKPGGYNRGHSKETRQKISKTLKGRKLPEETKRLIRKNHAFKGKKRPEHSKRMSGEGGPTWKGLDDDKITELYNNGLTQKEIGQIIGCSQSTIGRHLRHLKNNGTIVRKRYGYLSTTRMIALYSRGMNGREIAKIIGCNFTTVYRRLNANGVVIA